MNLKGALFRKNVDHYRFLHLENNLIATKLINVPAEIRKYWWENSENLINVPGTTISDSRVPKEITI